ncbi:ArsR/SmtB family transcription factor [Methylobacterium oryzisoli]|uniref:ArsR/SmtB family transcription factor n=1 Tax=Methylobacterium oryzisoli TaxID=3385502 RepID=UPI0038924F65
MSASDTTYRWAEVFSALGDPTRLALLATLAGGQPHSIVGLAGDTGLTRQAVKKHLRVLEQVGLVASERSGRESRYAYRPQVLREARDFLAEVSGLWDDALDRLRIAVEDGPLA